MNLIGIKCPNCGASIEPLETTDKIVCEFCGSAFELENKTSEVNVNNNAEVDGYNFEKGRQRAINETIRENEIAEKKKKNLVWWVLGWILFFPIPLSVIIYKNEKWSKPVRIILIVALWAILCVYSVLSEYV